MIFYQLIRHCAQKHPYPPPERIAKQVCWRYLATACAQLLLTIIFILSVIGLSAEICEAQSITITSKNEPLRKLMTKIEQQSGYDFWYSKGTIDEAEKINADFKEQSLESVLKNLFTTRKLSFEIVDKTIFLKSIVVKSPEKLNKFKTDIDGKVLDKNGKPIQNATVRIKNTNILSVADESGHFNISSPAEDGILVTSSLGFAQTETPFSSNKKPLEIVLQTADNQLDDIQIVSTGYENLPRERATGSFSTPNKEQFAARVSPGVLSRLEGITSGLVFNSGNKGPGENQDINIRGRSTIYSNDQPLIVVDNFPYNGNINDLNPNDVESITILKDAAAASIWGVKAGNGVIVITTKSGKKDQQTKISINANMSIGEKPNLYYDRGVISSSEYIEVQQFLFNKGRYDADLSNTTSFPSIPEAIEILAAKRAGQITSLDSLQGMNLLKAVDIRQGLTDYFYINPINQQYSLSISTGGKNFGSYFSAGYDNAKTPNKGVTTNRFTFNFQNVYTPIKNLQLTTQISYINGAKNSSNPLTLSNATSVSGTFFPYTSFYDSTGSPKRLNRDFSSAFVSQAKAQGFLDWGYYPIEESSYLSSETKTTDIRVSGGIRYTFIPSLNADIKYQFQRYMTDQDLNQGLSSYIIRNQINRYSIVTSGKVTGYNLPVGDIRSFSKNGVNSNNLRGQLSYEKGGVHAVNATAGAEVMEYNSHSENNKFYGYAPLTDRFSAVNNLAFFNLYPDGSGNLNSGQAVSNGTERFRSFFATASYTNNDKYIISVSARLDGSNYFGVAANQKSVPLWSAGLGWKISEEKFYALDLIPTLKLRGTYGYNGNLNRSVTGITTFSYNTGATWTNLPYAVITNLGNPELRWEKSGILNIGLDFGSRKGILTGSIDFFLKNGVDLIGDQSLAPSTGYISGGLNVLRGNFANMRGKGYDINLNSKNLSGTFSWSTSLNLSYALEKVTRYDMTSLSNGSLATGGFSILPVVGKPVYALYSFKWAGLDPQTGDPRGYIGNEVSKNYTSLNNPQSINDLVYSGSSRPKYFGGLGNRFSYRSVTMMFNISFKLGYYFRRSSLSYNNLFGVTGSSHQDIAERWQKPGDELVTTVPSMVYPAPIQRDNFYQFSEATIERGDHIRLQDISLSYDISTSRKPDGNKLQIYAYINNLGIIYRANNKKIDPDFPAGGIPAAKTYSIGIKTTF